MSLPDAFLEPILTVRGLTKNYGRCEALKGISFEVNPNEIFALIGPNGAGKTTTLRIVTTILSPSAGSVSVCGWEIRKEGERIRDQISYLPEEAGAYKNMTGAAYLRFMAELFSSVRDKQREYIETATEICGLGARLKQKIGTYSKGMTRKLLLARAVMTRPKLAVLDEPTSGLDVINAVEIRRVIRDLAKGGMSVLLSSHNMLEVEFLSDRVAIIDKGIIHKIGAPQELKKEYGANNLEEVFAEVVK